MEKIKITFWGVRGSLAAAGPTTAKYGGNTPCVEISYGNTVIICDAGTGIRPLGHELIRRSRGKRIEATILLSHLHLDHVIGLPFFKPIYKKGNRITIMSPGRSARKLKSSIKKIISPPYFPINILNPPSPPFFKGGKTNLPPFFKGGKTNLPPFFKGGVGGFESFKCNHPDNSYAFKFRLPNGKVVVYASDNEPSKARHKLFVRWLAGTDLLIHDAQYTQTQYKKKIGWGHSPYLYPIKLAADAGVKRLFLFHYDPAATDKDLDHINTNVQKFVRSEGLNVRVTLSREGKKILL